MWKFTVQTKISDHVIAPNEENKYLPFIPAGGMKIYRTNKISDHVIAHNQENTYLHFSPAEGMENLPHKQKYPTT
jgi:hypothetical protein